MRCLGYLTLSLKQYTMLQICFFDSNFGNDISCRVSSLNSVCFIHFSRVWEPRRRRYAQCSIVRKRKTTPFIKWSHTRNRFFGSCCARCAVVRLGWMSYTNEQIVLSESHYPTLDHTTQLGRMETLISLQ